MARTIRREDPEYEALMREAKVLFDAAMAKGAMKSRGRPPAAKASTTTASEAPDAAEASEVLAVEEPTDDELVDEELAAAEPEAELEPAPVKAKPKSRAGAAKPAAKSSKPAKGGRPRKKG